MNEYIGISEEIHLAIWVIWFKADKIRPELERRVMSEAIKQGWYRSPGAGKKLRLLINLAVQEHLYPEKMKPTALKLAYTGISRPRWYEQWEQRYKDLYKIIESWLDEAHQCIKNNSTL